MTEETCGGCMACIARKQETCANCGKLEKEHFIGFEKNKKEYCYQDITIGKKFKPKKDFNIGCEECGSRHYPCCCIMTEKICENCGHLESVHKDIHGYPLSKGCSSCRNNYHRDFPEGRECKKFKAFPIETDFGYPKKPAQNHSPQEKKEFLEHLKSDAFKKQIHSLQVEKSTSSAQSIAVPEQVGGESTTEDTPSGKQARKSAEGTQTLSDENPYIQSRKVWKELYHKEIRKRKKLRDYVQKELNACKVLRRPLSVRTNEKIWYAQKLYEKLLKEIDKLAGEDLI